MIAKLLRLDAHRAAAHTAAMQDPIHAVAAATHPDPYPWYARMRQEAPLAWDANLGLWVATGAAAVLSALAHPQLRVRPPDEPVPRALAGTLAGDVFARLVRMTDGDFHRAHKPQVEVAARQWDRAAVAAAATAAAEDLCRRTEPNALLSAVPVQAMARLLGVPQALHDATVLWVTQFTQGIAPGAGEDAVALADAAARGLMAQGEAEGLDPVRSANRIAFMQQALDATAGLVGNTLLALRRDPSLAHAAMDDVVDETARWDAPVQNTRRFAAVDLDLCGQRIRTGEGLLLVLASANRDHAFHPSPDAFTPGRAALRNAAFGSGAHACPGERIANAIATAAVPPLVPVYGRLRHTGYRPLPNARIPVFA